MGPLSPLAYTAFVKPRSHDPLKLDVAAFAADGGTLEGRWPVVGFARLAAATHEDARPAPHDQVTWRARGEMRARRNEAPEVWLHLDGEATLELVCQRCLAPVAEHLVARGSFLFVESEARAEELDAEMEEDVLAITRRLDLHELLEDELLLAIPLVPRHPDCAMPAMPAPHDRAAEGDAGGGPAAEHPFAPLRALRRDGGG
jgi:uncharacterized protein